METVLSRSFTAAADYRNYQYRFVYLSAEDTITLTGAGEAPIGILQNTPNIGEDAEVMLMGISRLSMSAAVAVNAKVGSAASGQGVTMSADTEIYGAICIQTCSNANEQTRVLLCPGAPTISV